MSVLDDLRNVTTGTITTMLLKRGIRHSWICLLYTSDAADE